MKYILVLLFLFALCHIANSQIIIVRTPTCNEYHNIESCLKHSSQSCGWCEDASFCGHYDSCIGVIRNNQSIYENCSKIILGEKQPNCEEQMIWNIGIATGLLISIIGICCCIGIGCGAQCEDVIGVFIIIITIILGIIGILATISSYLYAIYGDNIELAYKILSWLFVFAFIPCISTIFGLIAYFIIVCCIVIIVPIKDCFQNCNGLNCENKVCRSFGIFRACNNITQLNISVAKFLYKLCCCEFCRKSRFVVDTVDEDIYEL